MLSGFMGLDVVVNGEPANVIVGIGQNGTFERGDVPLTLGENIIQVTASDMHGNTTTKRIELTRTIPTGIQMTAVSGDLQTTNVHQRLVDPVVVKIADSDGTPFQNKVVTFNVTRSDGRLVSDPASTNAGVMKLQVSTDSGGLARAYWTLGGDAGCGNNRISVTSKDIAGTTFFCASALPAPATQINIGSGNNQRAEVNSVAPEPLRVWVSDSCNGVEGVPVTFTVLEGGGMVNGTNSVTVDTTMTGHALVNFTLGDTPGNQVVEASFAGNPGTPATFVIVGVKRDPEKLTSFRGILLDNASRPIGGARCDLTVGGVSVPTAFSDSSGQFLFDDIPAGPGHLHLDGLSATQLNGETIPVGSFPALTYQVVVVPNSENSLPTPALLPTLNPNNARVYDGTQDIELTCEGIDGLKMFVKAGSMRRADGSFPSPQDPAVITLNQVHHDDVPMPMPDGAAPPFAWTLQPAGATFDPPIKVEYPNMSGLSAGAIAYFLSFNHDTERFEIVASGHVTDDGSTIVTDRGAGIDVAGWGCNCPPYAVTGECANCPKVAVAVFKGGPASLDGSVGEGLETLANSIRSRSSKIFAKVFSSSDTNAEQLNAAIRWVAGFVTNGIPCVPPKVALIGHSLGGDTVLLSGAFEAAGIDVDLRITLDPISRNLALSLYPFICEYYQRNKTFSGPPGILNFLAEDLGPLQRILCGEQECSVVACLRGYKIFGSNNLELEGTDHGSVVEVAAETIIEEVVALLEGTNVVGAVESVFDSEIGLDSSYKLFAGSQNIQANNDGSFHLQNISTPDQFGLAGPGTPPDFLSDDFLRVTGVSTADGVTRYVYSERFQIRQGETFVIENLTFSDTPPSIPLSLTAIPDPPTLTEIGQTAQVTVVATMGDGTEENVTSSTNGTTYRISNTAIASVNSDGLVTALAEGSVFITAVNEGATAVTQLQVSLGDPLTTVNGFVLRDDQTPVEGAVIRLLGAAGTAVTDENGAFSIAGVATDEGVFGIAAELIGAEILVGVSGQIFPVPAGITDAGIIVVGPPCDVSDPECIDTDGDCLSDSLEVSIGLTPTDPDTNGNGISDGAEDSDEDGLSNCAEAALGTDATVADTDDDGLTDLEEIGLLTDPVSADTDGDHVSDGEEFFHGTDPFSTDTDRDGWSDEAEINGNGDPLNRDIGIQSIMTANPTVTVVLPQLGSGEGDFNELVAKGSFVVAPPVTVVAPNIGVLADGVGNLITNGSFVATPPVTVVAPNVGVLADSVGNVITNGSFVALPPITVVAPNIGADDMGLDNLITNGAFVAQPGVTLVLPNTEATTNEFDGLLVPGSFPAQPPVEIQIGNGE